ncbi:MAG: M23 family metallopeptidase [Polyangiaceae bacterium]
MPVGRRQALIVGAVLVAGVAAIVLAPKRPQRRTAATLAPPTAEPDLPLPLPLPLIEAEASVDPKLIPRLRMPFLAGFVVLCCQGNSSEAGRTHALPQNQHALDFSNRVLEDVPVVAAAAGTVAYVVDEAGSDENAGGGYGNQVRLLHEHGVFTLYAHLDRVLVRVGQHIEAGQQIGSMGRTGLAGDRHLHFSLHHGAIDQEGVPNTLPIPALVTWELDGSAGFLPRTGGEFRCSSAKNPWSGALYASENAGASTAPELASRIREAQSALSASLSRRARLWDFSRRAPSVSGAAYRDFLEPLLRETPNDPVVQYTWAVEVELAARRFDAANKHLDLAEKESKQSALFEPWLNGWIEAQRGTIALNLHLPNDAKLHFVKAQELLPIPEIEAFARQQTAQFGASR